MSAKATTIDERLLCASGCAYAVTEGESSLDPEAAVPYYSGVGFAKPPSVFQGGQDHINACVVGTTGDAGGHCFSWHLIARWPILPGETARLGERLERAAGRGRRAAGTGPRGLSRPAGFAEVRRTRRGEKATGPGGAATPLLVTGHSKGGAIAALAAMRLRTQQTLTPRVVTFAAPKPANKAFADAYNAAVGLTRYEFADDVVPHLPPSARFLNVLDPMSFLRCRFTGVEQYDYDRVATLLYFKRSLEIVSDPQNALLDCALSQWRMSPSA